MDDDPTTCLLDAVNVGDAEAVREALAAGADARGHDDAGAPIVLLAADTGEVELVTALLDAGAPVDAEDDCGYTPLIAAVLVRSEPLVELLIARGADVNRRDANEGDTVLTHAAKTETRPPSLPIVAALLRAGADANAAGAEGWTPLMLAAAADASDEPLAIAIAEALVAAGADVRASKGAGTLAVEVAAHHGHVGLVAWLRAHGSPGPADVAGARLNALFEATARWYATNAPAYHARLRDVTGAPPEAVDAIERAVGAELPADLRAYLLRYGGNEGVAFFEYDGLRAERALEIRSGLESLRVSGAFDAFAPRELSPSAQQVQWVWWHPAWVPFAQDSGGNLWCVDLAPGPRGTRGQVIAWEIHAGPVGPAASSLEAFVGRYLADLEEGRARLDGTLFRA